MTEEKITDKEAAEIFDKLAKRLKDALADPAMNVWTYYDCLGQPQEWVIAGVRFPLPKKEQVH
jgi:hypothetical protein